MERRYCDMCGKEIKGFNPFKKYLTISSEIFIEMKVHGAFDICSDCLIGAIEVEDGKSKGNEQLE